jgi:hypothetical protein
MAAEMPSKLQKESRKNAAMMMYQTELLLLSSKVVGDNSWQQKNSKGFKKEAKELSVQLVGDSRRNHLEERGNDTIQERSNLDFDVKYASIQFYGNNHNSQSDRLIGLKVYVESPEMLCYLRLNFQFNRSSERHRNTGQQRLYEFTSF